MKRKESAVVIDQDRLTGDIYSLRLRVSFAGEVLAGQFVSLFSADGRKLLPRPISVCAADPEEGEIRVVYRTVGEGTREFSRLKKGSSIEVMGPLGNGFPLERTAGKRVLLIGGGIGIPPMLFAAKSLAPKTAAQSLAPKIAAQSLAPKTAAQSLAPKFAAQSLAPKAGERADASACDHAGTILAALGYRTSETYLLEEMKELCPVTISTDDGSLGTHGTVLDAVRASSYEADIIFACGPKVMLRAVKEYAEETGAECYVSMEERMACGVGVCLGCVCRKTETDPHSLSSYSRVCTDGPVFPAKEVDLT